MILTFFFMGPKKLEKDICCSCGRSRPSRHHLTWHCPDRPVPESLIHPVHSAEEKLLLRSITKPPLMSRMPQVRVACNQLNNHIRTLPAQTVIACDGRMISKCDQARAAWAVATARDFFWAPSPGLDQHIHSAEAWALLVALRAADPTRLSFNIISDCHSVLQKAWRVRAGGALPRFAPGLWKEVSFLSPHSMLHFVPSHGKHLSWGPPGQHSDSVRRQLNSLADSKANSIAHREFQHIKAFCNDFDIAAHWSHQALTRQMEIISAFWKRVVNFTDYVVVVIQHVPLDSFGIAWFILIRHFVPRQLQQAIWLTSTGYCSSKQANTHTHTLTTKFTTI